MNKLVKCVTGMLSMIKLKILLYITLVSSDIITGEMTLSNFKRGDFFCEPAEHWHKIW